jgi:hypothetical protein
MYLCTSRNWIGSFDLDSGSEKLMKISRESVNSVSQYGPSRRDGRTPNLSYGGRTIRGQGRTLMSPNSRPRLSQEPEISSVTALLSSFWHFQCICRRRCTSIHYRHNKKRPVACCCIPAVTTALTIFRAPLSSLSS